MRSVLCVLLVALAVIAAPASAFKFGRRVGDANGGTPCAVCTVAVALLEQTASVRNASVDATIAKICDLFPAGVIRDTCVAAVDIYGPIVIDRLDMKDTPDVVCAALKFCTGTCHVFPPPAAGMKAATARAKAAVEPMVTGLPAFCDKPEFQAICNLINNFSSNHTPIADADGDHFSTLPTLRGSDWRGKDCNDHRADYHPGAKPIDWDVLEDSNCNGIFGVDPKSGQPYEKEWCGNSNPKGVAVIGDSASAHFHIPAQYMEPGVWDNTTFHNILMIAENEFDWPMFSAYTGHQNTSLYYPDITGPMNSTYATFYSLNRCNFRDFQNLGVNGAREGDAINFAIDSLVRNAQTDEPLLVIIAMIGNDVCNGHPDTIASMTTPAEMYASAMEALNYLDTTLPPGSDVILLGLANGSILYDAMANRIHPIGEWFQDVTYTALYDYLNCLEISPCSGWMNSNATLRYLTTQRAYNLSMVLQNITVTEHFSNINVVYVPNPIDEIIAAWTANGGEAWQLIEPIDGFHPNQIAMSLLATAVGEYVQTNFPEILGNVNPYNELIEKQFGNQGGY